MGTGAGVVFYGETGSILIPSGNAYTVYDNGRSPKVVREVTEATAAESQPNAQNTTGPGLKYDFGHVENFLASIRDGITPNSEIEGGRKSTLLCQLGNIAYRTGRTLNIDQRNGHIIGDPEAMKLWTREYEPGWEPRV